MDFWHRLFGHTAMILRHKAWVFYYCCHAGIPWQGFMHDWSKFSPMEFCESVRYYNGKCSPIKSCKEANHGRSLAWLHHHGRNLHHYEAWFDDFDHGAHPTDMTYPYAVEMICDFLGAGRAYGRSSFTYEGEYAWWQKKQQQGVGMTEHMQAFVEYILSDLAAHHDLAILRPQSTQAIYQRLVCLGKCKSSGQESQSRC